MSTIQQDARQLTAHIDGDHEGRIEQDGWGITIRVDHAEDPEMIRELTRRWNAHNDLLAALKAIRKWSNSRDGSAEADEAALTEINGIASAAIINATKTH